MEQYAQWKISFADESKGSELLYEGEIYAEWLVHQGVSVGDKVFANFHIVKSQGMTKITMGGPDNDENFSFILPSDDQNTIEFFLVRTNSGKNEYTNYFVSLFLRRI